MNRIRGVVLAAALAIAWNACAADEDAARPAPSGAAVPLKKMTLQIVEIRNDNRTTSGGGSIFLSPTFSAPLIEKELVERALIDGLEEARVFREIRKSPPADYDLYADIIFQKPPDPFNLTLLVRYRLLDAASRRLVWKEHIYSQTDMTFSASFGDIGGSQRRLRVQTEIARDNAAKLADRLLSLMRKLNADNPPAGVAPVDPAATPDQ